MTEAQWDQMVETYQEPVYRFRVLRQLNDALRNPEGEWTLLFSSDSFRQAMRVKEQEIREDKFGDQYKIEDSGSFAPSTITRSAI
jgi:hypothetical protein